jgi:hypothetical protein
MRIQQRRWTPGSGWECGPALPEGSPPQLLFAFGSTGAMADEALLRELTDAFPGTRLLGCSTAGEICGTEVDDGSLVATAVHFEHTRIATASICLADVRGSYEAGRYIAKQLSGEGLAHVLVLSDGLHVNGSKLVKGLTDHLPEGVAATGGLAGDGTAMQRTLVWLDGPPQPNQVAAVGFYGDRLQVGYGSMGGWDPFGPERLITRSEGNVLYELDGRSALALYRQYLGPHATDLPSSGLLFPLTLRSNGDQAGIVRTILSVDEADQSLTFAGDVPQGQFARFMKANFDRLVDGAAGAARTSYEAIGDEPPDLAILISCVGRKQVLQQRIEEEVESVREVLGEGTILTGFYSYGEICPFTPTASCELHNQTMTITTFSER